MIDQIKNTFALTETGAKGMVRASVGAFFMYIGYMLPITALMIFVQDMTGGTLKSIWFYIGMIGLVMVVMYGFINYSYKTTYTETYREAAVLRVEIAEILRKMPLSYFSRHNLADLSQTIMQDVGDIEHAMSHAIPELIGFSFYFILVALMLLVGNWKLGLAIIIPIVVSGLLLILSKRLQVAATTRYYGQLRQNADDFQEAIELQQEIKSYGQKSSVWQKLNEAIEKTEKMHISTEFAQAIPVTLSGALIHFTLGITVIAGAFLYLRGEVSLLFLLGYLVAAARIMDGVTGLYANVAELMYIDARIRRIQELRKTPRQEGETCDLNKYDIVFDGVSFAYHADTPVVKDVSFVARQGQVTALIGPSGCGKTTLLRLMSRLYDYDKGSITIDGVDIKKADTEDLFRNISIVFQDVTLFNTSIMENIRLGRKGASDEEVKEAARLARCEEFILKMPKGYETMVGENGMKLSGGERQRLSIARAILKNAPIILLDEISASLDVENEMAIQESLNHLIAGKTVVIISHRLKSIEKADQIVVMDRGQIEAVGRHEDLLASSPLYRSLQEKAGMTEAFEY